MMKYLQALDYNALSQLLGALLTPVIGITTLYIAWQQWRIKRTELNLKLYERRLTVYKALDRFYGEIAAAGKVQYSQVLTMRVETAEASFLFPKNIEKHLDAIYKKGVHAATLHTQMYPGEGERGLPVGPERSKVAQGEGDLMLWFLQESKAESKKLFGKYLRLA